jgi:FMN phosphatase YigB (HAD superfamily)
MMKPNTIILLDIDDTIFNTDAFKKSENTKYEMYDEVYSSLAELSKIAMLGIFSQGDVAFQRKKLHETNIQHYFLEEHIHIVDQKLAHVQSLLHRYKGKGTLYLIEDRLDVLQMAKQTDPSIHAIWMKRGRYAENQRVKVDFTADATIESLHELFPLIGAF